MKFSRSLASAAVAVSTLAAFTPGAFAAQQNQKAKVNVSSSTVVVSTQITGAFNGTDISQAGGNGNQKAKSNTSATNVTTSSINAISGNVIVISQD
jgi:hypothetical protein